MLDYSCPCHKDVSDVVMVHNAIQIPLPISGFLRQQEKLWLSLVCKLLARPPAAV